MKLFIGIPCHGSFAAASASCYAAVMNEIGLQEGKRTHIPPYQTPVELVGAQIYRDSILPRARHELAKRALDSGASHMLCLDSDMTYPPGLPWYLLRWNVPIVGANARRRVAPYQGTAEVDGELLDSGAHEGDVLQQVDTMGFGILMLETDVYRKIEPPWFEFPWMGSDAESAYGGEDIGFFQKARKAKIPAYVDHELSKMVGHVGEHVARW